LAFSKPQGGEEDAVTISSQEVTFPVQNIAEHTAKILQVLSV